MPAQWTGDMVGKMHNNKITLTQVAEKIGVTKAYVCMVLNGHRNPKGAEQRFMAALDELIKEKNLDAEIKLSGSFCMGECINDGVSVKVNGKIFFVNPGEEETFLNDKVLSEAAE